MKDYLIPEYIELCEKIQDEIEPEMGTWFHHKDDHLVPPRLIVGLSQPEIIAKHRDDYILFPDLGWLARKLAEYGSCERLRKVMPLGLWKYDGGIAIYEKTPELACLKALLMIKGIET